MATTKKKKTTGDSLQQRIDAAFQADPTLVAGTTRANKVRASVTAQWNSEQKAKPVVSDTAAASKFKAQVDAANAQIAADAKAKADAKAAADAKASDAKAAADAKVAAAKAAQAKAATDAAAAAKKAAADKAAAAGKTPGTTVVGGLLPGEVSGTPDVASAETLLQKNYAGQWGFWHQDDTKDANGNVIPGDLAKFLDGVIADGTLAAVQTGSQAAIDKFNMGLQATDWYKANGSQGMAAATVQYSQPTTWQESIKNRSSDIAAMATSLGYKLDPLTIGKLAEASLYQAYDPTVFNSNAGQLAIQSKITQASLAEKLSFTGGAGLTNYQTLQKYVQDMGGGFSDQWAQDAANSLNDPNKQVDINTYKNMVLQHAMSKYSGYAPLLKSGATVASIAEPFIQSKARIMEIDPNTINYTTDQDIQKGLGVSIGPDGTSVPMTNWQFENQLRTNPQWALTNNARDAVTASLHKIGQDMGFVS